MKTLEERFNTKWIPEPNSGCWLWTGTVDNYGYGVITVKKKGRKAHHISLEILKQVTGICFARQVDHICCIKCCVNPDHLRIVSPRENILRTNSPSAINARKTHCIHGHEFTKENSIYRSRKSGGKRCRICHNITRNKQRRKAREHGS